MHQMACIAGGVCALESSSFLVDLDKDWKLDHFFSRQYSLIHQFTTFINSIIVLHQFIIINA